ncbi:hypothetical protein NXV13_25900 [Bacteroides ovatus]|nr:hypothetical protein [Bacteroides ovatus]
MVPVLTVSYVPSKAGHDAIVVVNSCRLPGNSEEEIAYHAAVVLDVNEEEVTLYDPATGEESTYLSQGSLYCGME